MSSILCHLLGEEKGDGQTAAIVLFYPQPKGNIRSPMQDFFRSLFGNGQPSRLEKQHTKPVDHQGSPPQTNGVYHEGDVIEGKYEICRLLGRGGFGTVSLARTIPKGELVALKSFSDEYLADASVRAGFKKEVLLWVRLEEHPFVLAARWVQEFSGRLFVQMDYVAPDSEGRVHLGDHLQFGEPIPLVRMVEWAIQFCLGMEHANAHGIRCHRDIKPANILIMLNTVKIADFGLAAVEDIWKGTNRLDDSSIASNSTDKIHCSIMRTDGGVRCGTPGYMAPEIYRGESADVRSDIYSFGLVLWQMATGSSGPPFIGTYNGDIAAFMRETYGRQINMRLPPLNNPLDEIIQRCLNPLALERYSCFGDLRNALMPHYQGLTGHIFTLPSHKEQSIVALYRKGVAYHLFGRNEEALSCIDKALAINARIEPILNAKACVLNKLGRYNEAIECLDRALEIDPRSSAAWSNKGDNLCSLGRHEEALICFDHSLAINPKLPATWFNKGNTLKKYSRNEDAIACYDKALAIDPKYVPGLYNKANTLRQQGRFKEAIACYDKALSIDPLDTKALNNKGNSFRGMERYAEAIDCYDKVLSINPRDEFAWFNKGCALNRLKRYDEAIAFCDKALEINPLYAPSWNEKAFALLCLKLYEESIFCYDKAVNIDPQDVLAWCNKGSALNRLHRFDAAISHCNQALAINPLYAAAWNEKGYALLSMKCYEEAIFCYEKVVSIHPQDALAWSNKALAEDATEKTSAAISSFRKFMELASPQNAEQIIYAQKRILELSRK